MDSLLEGFLTWDAIHQGTYGGHQCKPSGGIQTGKTVDEPNRMKFQTEEFYLKSEEELRARFPGCDEAFENTAKIAEQCSLDFTFHEYHLPAFPVPEGVTNEEYFRSLCMKGFAERYPQAPQSYRERLNYEMGVISRSAYRPFVETFMAAPPFQFLFCHRISGISSISSEELTTVGFSNRISTIF